MLLYRWEFKGIDEAGNVSYTGPYNTSVNNYDKNKLNGIDMYDHYSLFGHMDEFHKTPQTAIIEDKHLSTYEIENALSKIDMFYDKSFMQVNGPSFCAFLSIHDMNMWFNPYEQDEMRKLGFDFVEYTIDDNMKEYYINCANTQIIFSSKCVINKTVINN